MTAITKKPKQQAKKKGSNYMVWALVGLGIAGLGVGAWYFLGKKKKSGRNVPEPEPTPTSNPQPSPPRPSGGGTSRDKFPLRYGSKGPNVKRFQRAMVNRFGAGILPRFGADGDWGSETQKAFDKLREWARKQGFNFPNELTYQMFQKFVVPNAVAGLDDFHSLPSGGRKIRTMSRAPIWGESADITLDVPEGMVLGRELRSKGGITAFINGRDEIMYVHTQNVSYAG